jgi:hypothetical protein
LLLQFSFAHAQEEDIEEETQKPIILVKQSIFPVTVIGLGLWANQSDFEKDLQVDVRNSVGQDYSLRIDDVIQYAPIAELYIADAFGVKAKNHWFDQTKYLLISNLGTAIITHSIKRSSSKARPNGAPHSFPSGHTSFVSTNATVLYREFKDSAPIIAYSGYGIAATTGAFRMINNKHWFSDVLVGAGIGILVTNVVYYFEPLKSFNPFKNSPNVTIIPQIDSDNYGLYFSYQF